MKNKGLLPIYYHKSAFTKISNRFELYSTSYKSYQA